MTEFPRGVGGCYGVQTIEWAWDDPGAVGEHPGNLVHRQGPFVREVLRWSRCET